MDKFMEIPAINSVGLLHDYENIVVLVGLSIEFIKAITKAGWVVYRSEVNDPHHIVVQKAGTNVVYSTKVDWRKSVLDPKIWEPRILDLIVSKSL